MPAPVLQFKRGNAGVAGTVPALRPGEPAISLNNFDFFIGIDTSVANNKFFGSHRYWGREDGTNSLRLKLVDKDGTNYIALKTPNTLAGNVTYTLPGTQGASSSVLTNDGNGNLTWASGSANPVFSGIATFTDGTDNTLGNADTGAVQVDGGLGVNKNVTVGGNLNVQGYSEFVGVVTFRGGTINIGDSNTDNINVAGEFVSNLTPNDDNTYDIGIGTQRWRDANFAGVVTATTFNGSLSGNASSADQVKTVNASDTNANYYVTFVDANNGSATNESVYTDDGIYYNPGTNTFTTQNALFTNNVTVNGTITGTATTATRATLVDTTGTSDNTTYYATFVDTSTGQTSETLRTGTALSLNASTGNVKSAGDLVAGSGYLASANGTRSMYMFDTSGDVSFQGKVIANNIRSSSNSANTLTLADLDATFARNLNITGITTVGSDLIVGGDITVGGDDIKASNGTTALTLATSGAVTAQNDLTVNGNLYVAGSTTQVNTASLTVEDRTIDLGIVNGAAPASSTTWDLGVLFNYYTAGAAKKSAVIWEHGDSRFKFASVIGSDTNGTDNNTPQLSVTTFAPIEVAELWVNNTCTGGSQQVIGCVGSELQLQNVVVDAGTF